MPKEINEDEGLPKVCGRLRKALYGTRIAAKCWEKEYTKTFLEMGFERGVTSPCLFKHISKDMCAFVHGDDFVISGTELHLNSVRKFICERYLTKVRGLIGPEPHDEKAIVILNRIIEWREDGIVMEADPRHVEMILKELGMESCKGSDVVGATIDMCGDDVKLSKDDATTFRSLAARCNFLSADRPDIQYACKEICRRMSEPSESD